jgi:DNA recombination protein RmuC
MKDLATGVGDLKKIFANVKSRGVIGEVLLGNQLDEMLATNQYIKNAQIKPNSRETVEYAIKVPSVDGAHVLLPIDAKFPREDWERLEDAYQRAVPEDILSTGKAFENAIKQEAKRISEKYIDPPATTPYAILYLPTEGLYAEVVRRPGLLAELQSKCRITVAGPTTFMAILSSFQLVFHTVALQKKGEEVWKVLAGAKQEFEKFGGLIAKVEKQVGAVQNTLLDIGKKTRTINRSLKSVTSDDALETLELPTGSAMLLPALAAGGEEEQSVEDEE